MIRGNDSPLRMKKGVLFCSRSLPFGYLRPQIGYSGKSTRYIKLIDYNYE
jgi:hypothetical protein